MYSGNQFTKNLWRKGARITMQLAIEGGKPVRDRMLPIFRLEIDSDEYENIKAVLNSGQISRGIRPSQFERSFAEYVRAKHAVVVNSGTAALHLALMCLDLPPGSEVITSSLSFVATAFAAEYCGLRPVFIEIEPETYNMSPVSLHEYLEKKSNIRNLSPEGQPQVILPVHYAGKPCDMRAIREIADAYGLLVVEDAAHALGARYWNNPLAPRVGSCRFAELTTFSFFATKNITGGEGGVITTNDEHKAKRMRRIKAHGIEPLGPDYPQTSGYYDVTEVGYNYHLSNINIALVEAQLPKLEMLNAKRRDNAAYLTSLLGDIEEIRCPQLDEDSDHVFHLYTIQLCLERITVSRDQIVAALLAEGIQVGVYYRPIHLFSYFRHKYGYREGDLPITETICNSIITLPMYPLLTKRDCEDISLALHKVISRYRR
jgi:dTDP-4-amino-4,6-dideoxygalactose transaminase